MRLRRVITSFLTGVMMVGSAWAGIGLAPVADTGPTATEGTNEAAKRVNALLGDGARTSSLATLGTDELYVGASKISLEPNPGPGEIWERDRETCLPVSGDGVDPQAGLAHVADFRTPWVENNNCIYMGGYGLGPSNPVTDWDQTNGLWVRSAVFADANNDSVVLTIIDAEGYFADYNKLCGPDEPRCGALAIAQDLAVELGTKSDGFIIASTHSHTALDLIGGWGGVPAWYMDQVATAIKDSIRAAWNGRVPAKLYGGETIAREFNNERRDFYRSAEDPTINWLRAETVPTVTDPTSKVITAVGVYAAHPVNEDEGSGLANGDFPPIFSKRVEARFPGSIGLVLQAGLGNMSPRGGSSAQGIGLANRIGGVGEGTLVTNPDVRAKRVFWDQPLTNVPLGSLGVGGFFDRPFSAGPATIRAGKSGNKPCVSASAFSANVSVTAAKIGNAIITAAPGEIFANYSNTIEERAPITLAIAQANDALGYLPQSFETDHLGRQGVGFVGQVAEYEDAYSIDHCFGDMALESTLTALGSL